MSQSVHPQTARSQLARRVAATARARGLLRPGDRVLAAVSGGPDSVALLSVLAALAPSWDLTLQAVHVNHGLRGAESDEDASFVVGFCDRLGVALAIERVTLVGPAGRRRGRSLQEQAREARYAAMVRVATALRMDKIALGHTADEQAGSRGPARVAVGAEEADGPDADSTNERAPAGADVRGRRGRAGSGRPGAIRRLHRSAGRARRA